jgi:4-hydroxy-3-polyprenylbenzoate decarboxylase
MLLVIGISGASGVIYGIRLLQVLSERKDIETHLMISEAAEKNMKYETDWKLEDVKALATFWYGIGDISARLASGSFKRDGMIIAPCSIKTMSALANSYTDNLLIRAGDVALKEKKKLVLLVRESPLHLGHLRNMEKLAEMGAVIMPPVPAFYNRPKTIGDIVDHTVGRILDVFNIEHELFHRWMGSPEVEAFED